MRAQRDKLELPGFEVRPATAADLDDIVTLLNASSADTLGSQITAGHWQKRQWQESQLSLVDDTRIAVSPSGIIAGYIQLSSDAPYLVSELSGAVHPEFRQRGIGSFLLAWAEHRALQLIPYALPAAAVFIQSSPFDRNQPALDLYQRRGYTNVRRFIHLRIEMATPPPKPDWPDGLSVQVIKAEDWPAVVAALGIAFQDHWGQVDEQRLATLAAGQVVPPKPAENREPDQSQAEEGFDSAYFNTPGLCFAAMAGDTVVGSCLCNARSVEFADAGRLGSLSVLPSWRRQGIGLALTLHALAEFYRRDIRAVVTDTDGQSFTGANFLYPQAGMSIFRSELVYEKTIRPGQDLLRRQMISDS